VWKQCVQVLISYIGNLFRATFTLKIYPAQWRDSLIRVLCKPGKPNYIPGAYRPIALLDTLGKILSSCVTEDIEKMAEKHELLPANHFGCRPGHTTTDALHYTLMRVKNAWRKGTVPGALFLDIRGDFPRIILDRLIHNMCCRGVPKEYTDWIRDKVEGRITTLSFDDYSTPLMPILQGIDQGCRLSAIAYQFYNVDLLDMTCRAEGEDVVAFVNDATILAEGADLEEAFEKLSKIMTRTDGVLEWAEKHDCLFALDKFGLVGFTRRWERDTLGVKKKTPAT
jgi:Reverse transcriptase (RNA-dependent DNA polymerase)